ncbi:hypothetical protein BDA96_01G246600 [Sorghum bicolor]|nr:hypothetical protein BDA96_01G246600 [Sorghum bicolor]
MNLTKYSKASTLSEEPGTKWLLLRWRMLRPK